MMFAGSISFMPSTDPEKKSPKLMRLLFSGCNSKIDNVPSFVFINNPITIIVTMMVVLFFSRAYENVSDGKFVNAVKQENRFAHTNLKYLFSRSGHALGTYISGLLITIGINYVFMMGAIMVFIQIVIICLALWYLKKDIQKDDFKNKRLFIKKYAMVKDVKSVLNKKKYRAKF